MKSAVMGILTVLAGGALLAQASHTVELRVKESAGIRRTAYPVNARVALPEGALMEPSNTRLVLGDMETPVQIAAESKWPDGSVQNLAVDFNASIGPMETAAYRLEYGAGAQAKASANGLNVTESATTIDVGRLRFNKSGAPLIASVKYRSEVIGSGVNGLVVTDASGKDHDLSEAAGVTAEVVKRGPLYVLIRYTGKIGIDAGYAMPFTMTVEMPNSKSWVKVAATVDDPAKRAREISLRTPLALGPMPWEWDFGTERWTYGVLRKAEESAELIQTVKAQGPVEWKISAAGQVGEAGSAERGKLIRWGHLQDGKEVIAFAVDAGPAQAGAYTMTFDGSGQTAFRFRPAAVLAKHALTVWEHYVAPPVQIGAATSPPSILAPLTVTVGAAQ